MIARGIVLQPENSIDLEPGAVTLIDQSRYKNDGAMTDITWTQLPSGLWVMSFNGATSEVAWSPSIILVDNVPWSYEFWLHPTIQDENTTLMGNLLVGGATTRFQITSNSIKVYNDANDGAIWALVSPTYEWYHLVLTADGTDANNMQLYINTLPQGLKTLADSSQTFRVLGHIGDGDREYNGYLGMASVNVGIALTAGQVTQHYEKTKHWFGVHD